MGVRRVKRFKNKVVIILLLVTVCLIGDYYSNSHKNFKDKSIYLANNSNKSTMNIKKEKKHTYSMKISNNDIEYMNAFDEMKVVLQNKFNIEQRDINVLWNDSTVYKIHNGDVNSAFASEFLVVFKTDKNFKYGMCLFGTDSIYKDVKLLDYDSKSIILNVV